MDLTLISLHLKWCDGFYRVVGEAEKNKWMIRTLTDMQLEAVETFGTTQKPSTSIPPAGRSLQTHPEQLNFVQTQIYLEILVEILKISDNVRLKPLRGPIRFFEEPLKASQTLRFTKEPFKD